MQELIETTIRELYDVQVSATLSRPDAQFGDLATNVALQLTKIVGQPPREIAEQIAAKLRQTAGFEEVSIAGPGFINIRLTNAALLEQLAVEPKQTLAGKKVLVEYSDPNPLKPLHAGHLYTTLVGDTIARLIERAGAETIRLNFGGDVGMHTAKSMWGIIHKLGGENPADLETVDSAERPAWLGERYVEGNNAYEEDETAKAEIIAINKRVYLIHSQADKESPFAKLYWTVRQWSYDYFHTLYDQLQVQAFDRFIPESEVTPLGLQTVQAHIGSVYEKSTESNAIVFDGEKYGLHTRVFINSEGLPTYEAKDVGLSLTKWNDYHFDESIIITATEQKQYMQVVIKSIEQFAPEPAERTKHLTHGVVKLSGGVKMSSRKGNIVSALDILQAAREAGKDSGFNPNEETILAAVKYAFARVRLGSDIAYDPKESISLDGNSGPYLQYAHARACSILAKSTLAPDIKQQDFDTAERTMVRKLGEYSQVVEKATEELAPHSICTYLFELAQEFNRFYEKSRIIGDEREIVRLGIVKHYAKTLGDGLGLLGIVAPQAM